LLVPGCFLGKVFGVVVVAKVKGSKVYLVRVHGCSGFYFGDNCLSVALVPVSCCP
jgi:hypothetical protein